MKILLYIKSKIKIFSLLVFTLLIILGSCFSMNEGQELTKDETRKINLRDSSKTILESSKYIGDSLLNNYSGKVAFYVSKFDTAQCIKEKYSKSLLRTTIEGVKEIGTLLSTNKLDSVFILPPINRCEIGQSFYFSDTIFPRLETTSNCCHVEDLFILEDIDEDGVNEIGYYYSSCSSRYKSLYVYSLKNNIWQKVGHCVFDLNFSKPVLFNNFIRKTSKGSFEMLEVTDLSRDKYTSGKPLWLEYQF